MVVLKDRDWDRNCFRFVCLWVIVLCVVFYSEGCVISCISNFCVMLDLINVLFKFI